MNTKTLMTVSSFVLGFAGIFALFAPQELLAVLSSPLTNPLPAIIQLLGALYLSFAFTNWTAKAASSVESMLDRPPLEILRISSLEH